MVRVTGLVKWFRGEGGVVRAVDDISFEVPEGQLFTLLGPSGCGKSTTLRCLAGLEKPDAGEIAIGGRPVFSKRTAKAVPPHQRNIGMVFQSYAIWPHMSVFENVAYPLRVGKGLAPQQMRQRVERALELVKLTGLEDRPAPYLSGGQQQRLALARALVREPQVLLLDEPLSNLDAKLREHMRFELRQLQRQLGITTIYVTHDQLEALVLSTTIAVMNEGRIVQVGRPREIYEQPQNRFVADFFGSTNLLSGQLLGERADGLREVQTEAGLLLCADGSGLAGGSKVLVSIRPENIEVSPTPLPSLTNVWEATVQSTAFLGEYLDCQFGVGQLLLRARLHPSQELQRGERVFLRISPKACILLPWD